MANKYLEKIANDVSQKKKRHENAVLTGALGVVGAHQGSKIVAGLIGRSSLEDLGKAEPYLRPDLGTSYLKDHDLDVVARRKASSFSRKPTGGTSFAYSAVHGMGPHAVDPWISQVTGLYRGTKYRPKHGFVNMDGAKSRAAYLHELGHLNFRKNLGTTGSKAQSILYGLGTKGGLSGILPVATFLGASSDSDKKSKALSTLSMLPTAAVLGEEAIASGSALKHIIKKQGVSTALKASKSFAKPFSTYGVSLAVPQAVAYGLGRRLRTAKLEHRKAVEESKGLQKTASNQEVSTPVPQPNLTRETLKNMGTDMAFSLPASAVGAGLGVVGAHSLAQGSMKGAASDLWNSAKKKVSGLRMSKGMGKAGLVASLPLIGYELGGHVGSYFGRRHHLQRMEAQQAKPM